MATKNINKELDKLSRDLTIAFQDELRKQGLVESGALVNSIKVTPIQTTTGFTLRVEALDYFQYLDDKHNITNNVLNGSSFKNIQEQIVNLYSSIIIDNINIK